MTLTRMFSGEDAIKAELAKAESILRLLLDAGGQPTRYVFASYTKSKFESKRIERNGAVQISTQYTSPKFGKILLRADASTDAVTAMDVLKKEGLKEIASLLEPSK